MFQFLKDLFQLNSSSCELCCENSYIFSYCPYFNGHKWCEECNRKLNQCPYCRKKFRKEVVVPYQEFVELIFVNRPVY